MYHQLWCAKTYMAEPVTTRKTTVPNQRASGVNSRIGSGAVNDAGAVAATATGAGANNLLRRWSWSGFQCAGDLCNSAPLLDAMLDGVQDSGAHVRHQSIEQFVPHGVTLVLVLSESHFVVSTWPEFGFASIDISVCSDLVELERLSGPLVSLLAANHAESQVQRTAMQRQIEKV